MLEVISNQSFPMAAIVKPKERQFQVVPVPAIFTRGRWECRDYKEAPNFVVTSNHNGGENSTESGGGHTVMAGPVGDYIDKPTTSPSAQGEIPSTIPLMRNDAKNVAAAQGGGTAAVAAILPDILPSASVGGNGNVDSGTFVPQQQDEANKESTSGITGNVGSNQVAIDNKIEQAMDLVKTHLTFAVREEVEQLRTQISELESRVNNLEGENQILRQFAPPEIVANLPLLLQNSQQQPNGQQQHKSSLPPQQSTVAISGFENTLASIPSVSSAPVLTTMAGPPASTALIGSCANNGTVAAVTHTISTTQSSSVAPSQPPMGAVTLHIGGSATPSPPATTTPTPFISDDQNAGGIADHQFQQQQRSVVPQQQPLGSPTSGASNFVVTSTRSSTPAHEGTFTSGDFQKY